MKKYNYKKRKICIVTTNRADYSHLKNVILNVNKNKDLILKLVVSGSHLSKLHGYSVQEILKDRIPITKRIKIDVKDDFDKTKITKTLSKILIKFDNVIKKINPDIILILGDRYEILPVAQVALFRNIPLAHIHGGEVTSGVLDEQIRHAVTKFSDIHLVANKIFAKNVLSLGENKKNIFVVGSPGCENLDKKIYFNKNQLEKKLNLKFFKKNILVTIHPQIDRNETYVLVYNLLSVIKKLKNTLIIFTGVNPDINSDIISKILKKFRKLNNFKFYHHLGQNIYLSLAKQIDFVIGNSSSGFIEFPFLKIPVINIGERQSGRPISKNIIQVNIEKRNIKKAIKKVYTPRFKKNLKLTKSFYFKKGTSAKIIKILKNIKLKNIKIKKFQANENF